MTRLLKNYEKQPFNFPFITSLQMHTFLVGGHMIKKGLCIL